MHALVIVPLETLSYTSIIFLTQRQCRCGCLLKQAAGNFKRIRSLFVQCLPYHSQGRIIQIVQIFEHFHRAILSITH